MASYVCAPPPLVTTIVSSVLPVVVTKCPFAVDTHTLCAVGVGLRFWWRTYNATGFQVGAFLYGHFQGIRFTLGRERWGSFVYYLGTWWELVLWGLMRKRVAEIMFGESLPAALHSLRNNFLLVGGRSHDGPGAAR